MRDVGDLILRETHNELRFKRLSRSFFIIGKVCRNTGISGAVSRRLTRQQLVA